MPLAIISNVSRPPAKKDIEYCVIYWQREEARNVLFEKAAEWQYAKSQAAGQKAKILRQVACFKEQKSKSSRAIFGFHPPVVADQHK